jgi:hypothetical protein
MRECGIIATTMMRTGIFRIVVDLRKKVILMKRYFDATEEKYVMELELENGSAAATAPVERYEKMLKTKMREVDQKEYNKLKKQYTAK